ncbi:hypothetical protein BSG1_08101 [Bacillus sp. SG-1]|nr:hypothetical protein BSG1_08101 [Bacillus sp. SG-1]
MNFQKTNIVEKADLGEKQLSPLISLY